MAIRFTRFTSLVIPCLLAAAGGIAAAQSTPPKDTKTAPATTPATTPAPAATPALGSQPVVRSTGIPQRDTLLKMQRIISISFNETPMTDVMKFIMEVTGADMEVMWADDQNATGLDKEKQITLKVERVTALALLEKVLEKATTDSSGAGGNTWQMSEIGTLQCGPRERLNKFKRVEIYSVRDLLLDIPNYPNAPEFDLQSVLQSSGQGGGGSSQSPFRDNGNQPPLDKRTVQQRVDELQKILTDLIEPEQWADNGGDGATIRFYQSTFIVNAPDYVHRALNGYPYWSQRATKVAVVNGHRYVTLGVDTALAGLAGIENQPVTIPGPK